MLTTNIKLAEKYNYLEEKFKKAYEFLKRDDLSELPVGAIAIDGDDVIANIQHYVTDDSEKLMFESHDKFFDVQYIIEGEEFFGYVEREGLEVYTEYNEKNDITFYKEPKTSGYLLLKQGDFAIVSPEDAHKPRCCTDGRSNVKKVVVKVRV